METKTENKNLETLTDEAEWQNISRAYDYDGFVKKVKAQGEYKREDVIKETMINCAALASLCDPAEEAHNNLAVAGLKSLVAIGAAAGICGLANITYQGAEDSLFEGTVNGVIAFPFAAGLGYLAKRMIFGKHEYGKNGRYPGACPPSYSIVENLKLANNWIKIEDMQKEGLIKIRSKETERPYGLYFHSAIWGP